MCSSGLFAGLLNELKDDLPLPLQKYLANAADIYSKSLHHLPQGTGKYLRWGSSSTANVHSLSPSLFDAASKHETSFLDNDKHQALKFERPSLQPKFAVLALSLVLMKEVYCSQTIQAMPKIALFWQVKEQQTALRAGRGEEREGVKGGGGVAGAAAHIELFGFGKGPDAGHGVVTTGPVGSMRPHSKAGLRANVVQQVVPVDCQFSPPGHFSQLSLPALEPLGPKQIWRQPCSVFPVEDQIHRRTGRERSS